MYIFHNISSILLYFFIKNLSLLLIILSLQKNQHTINNSDDSELGENYFGKNENKWVPYLKYNTVKNKISGMNSLFIFRDEMEQSEKIFKNSKELIGNIINGGLSSMRYKYKEQQNVEVDIQVDLLNEQATDPNLLGRMWIGWSPFI